MLKKLKMILCSVLIIFNVCVVAKANDDTFEDFAEEDVMVVPEEVIESDAVEENAEIPQVEENADDKLADEVSVDALNNYDMNGSLFEKITMLEQDKVVLQLEKERAQLNLELERLNAEKMKLQMELDTLSGRAEHQQQELEVAKAQLEAQAEKLKRQKEDLEERENKSVIENDIEPIKTQPGEVSARYRVINIVGMGNQLQATIEEISSGQNKRVTVGKDLDGYTIKSISLSDGIVFEKDGVSESLNIGK